jgi:hypothetical protein
MEVEVFFIDQNGYKLGTKGNVNKLNPIKVKFESPIHIPIFIKNDKNGNPIFEDFFTHKKIKIKGFKITQTKK